MGFLEVTVLLVSRADLNLDNFERVAWAGEAVSFDETAKKRMAACRLGFVGLIEKHPEATVYGVTSGYGQHAHIKLSPDARRAQAARPPSAAAASFGAALPERVTRGIVFARLANFVEGHAAVTPALAEGVAGLLGGEPLPPVPAHGTHSAGEIVGLSHLFLPLAQRFGLGPKESLSLVNGSPCASALIADAVLAARRRLGLAVKVFALSIEALRAPLEAYDQALDELWEDTHEAGILRRLRAHLTETTGERRPYQAPVSWRIVPRVLGQAARALAQAERIAEISLKAVSDNPVYLPPSEEYPDGRVLSNGGYHNAKAYPALDNLAAAWADLALLCDRHATKLMDGRVSLLPDHLTTDGGYIGCLCFTAADYADQARSAAQRTFLPASEGGGFGQNDVAVPTFAAWRKEAESGRCLDANLAILAAIASQALFITERDAPLSLRPLLATVRAAFPPVVAPIAPGPPAGQLAEAFTSRVYAPER